MISPAWVLFHGVIIPAFIVAVSVMNRWSENQRVLAEDLRLAQQRETIALDVHDLLGHSLTVINLRAELAQRLLESEPQQAKEELATISQLSRSALADIRSTVTRMKQPNFAGEIAAAQRALETVGIAADLPDPDANVGTNHAVFSWAVRELVTNVVRHSQARRCTVRVTDQKLFIEDDGIGFELPDDSRTGGIAGLTRRVNDAGGQLVQTSRNSILVTMNGDTQPL